MLPDHRLFAGQIIGLIIGLPMFTGAQAATTSDTATVVPLNFEASYSILVDDKPRIESRITLTGDTQHWTMQSESKGVKGMARLLKASSNEESHGLRNDFHFLPQSYSSHSRLAGTDEIWSAAFAQDKAVVTTRHEDGVSELTFTPPTVDPLSLNLAIAAQLQQGKQKFVIHVVDEDEIDEHIYRAGLDENLPTELGCLKVKSAERVRENSKRFSTIWFATELNYVPVRVLHGKHGSRTLDMRITSLNLNGRTVDDGVDCES